MKTPLILTTFIIAIGAFWGVSENRHLSAIREKHRKVVEEADLLGISSDVSKPFISSKASRRGRDDTSRKVADLADGIVSFAKQMKDNEKSGVAPDENVKKRMVEFLDGMLSLNGEELKVLIENLKTRGDLENQTRGEIIGFSIMMLAQQHPQSALAVFAESADLLKDNPMGKHVISSALTQWAKDEPLAAMEWIRKNSEKNPDFVNMDTKRAVVMGAALNDFGLAFQLAAELKSAEGNIASGAMARMANTPERQAEFLTALRKQAGAMDKTQGDKLLKDGMSSLFGVVSESGYDHSMEWLKTSNVGPSETAELTSRLNYYQTKSDTGKWLNWMAAEADDNGPLSSDASCNLFRQWTENDYKAAGEWLVAAAAGPVKEAVTLTYLETVAPYDSEVAAQWAATLEGEKRKDAMVRIYNAIEVKDKKAAAEFAKAHGIQIGE